MAEKQTVAEDTSRSLNIASQLTEELILSLAEIKVDNLQQDPHWRGFVMGLKALKSVILMEERHSESLEKQLEQMRQVQKLLQRDNQDKSDKLKEMANEVMSLLETTREISILKEKSAS